MPFVDRTSAKQTQPPTDAKKLFIGRASELQFFLDHVLKPEKPSYNIISIWGQGGVGKSTLFTRIITETAATNFKDYCLTALVDERQTTPVSVMEKLADQLGLSGAFEKALGHYKESLRRIQIEQEAVRETILRKTGTMLSTAVKEIPVPFVNMLAEKGTEVATDFVIEKWHAHQMLQDAKRLEDPIGDLTKAFVDELNTLADTQITTSLDRTKRRRRVLLFFDTFEQLGTDIAPWLLDVFLETTMSMNIVLVIAGRLPIERSIPHDPKRWLPYFTNEVLSQIPLESFTQEETHKYLVERGITESDKIATIWQLSRGLPLYLGLLTSNAQGKVDPTADVVANFLRWIPEKEPSKRRLVLDAALLSRPFNQDDLAAFPYLSAQERPVLYQWLIAQPFIRNNPQDGRNSYHELAQELFCRHLYQLSPAECCITRVALAQHYGYLLQKAESESGKEIYDSPQWLELNIAMLYQLFLLPDEAHHIKAIEKTINIEEHVEESGELIRFFHDLVQGFLNRQLSIGARHLSQQFLCILESRGESTEALRALNSILEKIANEPAFPKTLLASTYDTRGDTYYNLKNYQQALTDYSKAIELAPDQGMYYNDRGDTYYALKDYWQALPDYSKAIELAPEHAGYYNDRGNTYYVLKDYWQALTDYSKAIELTPDKVVYYNNRGNAYYHLKNYQQALADYSKAIELAPEQAVYYNNRGDTYYDLKDYPQALADYSKAIELAPDQAVYYSDVGRVYRQMHNYEQALINHIRAIELDPELSVVYNSRGFTYLWMKDLHSALVDYTQSWRLDSEDSYVAWMIDWITMCQENAIPQKGGRLEVLAQHSEGSYDTLICRGMYLWLCKRYDEAREALASATTASPEEFESHFWKAMIYVSLGQDGEAIQNIEQALQAGLPPILLSPLRWFEQDRPDFYHAHVKSLFARFDLSS